MIFIDVHLLVPVINFNDWLFMLLNIIIIIIIITFW